ncbi:Ribose ABC transport system, permease protein RbsC (plasmid) [Sinorhizobium sojae CCBAU 05684]|uniref:Ribose ABC transport system, permease protein RbsC n=1 Tax=Sinorhizobium sojae CCBAU 05684 TaxID=716928 RepID=A0A249PL32_9HYPH|nr:ABC transporter permease [Sinorhizobium sojae]ASY66425.1 Ribose ABC transport system, permease protein RbsC [Sinorhizobium sojae CCBAU 05684]
MFKSLQLTSIRPRDSLMQLALPAVIVSVFLGFGLVEPAMLSSGNIANVLKQGALFFFLAAAQLVVLITRGFDLSVGACVSLVSVAASMVMTAVTATAGPVTGVVAGVATGLLIGAAIGAINGTLVAYGRINPFVATLATMSIFGGLSTTISGGFPIFDLPRTFTFAFNEAWWLFLPAPVTIAVLVGLALHVVLSSTAPGRVLYLLGDSPAAAHAAGLKVRLHLCLAYVASGLLAALAGLLMTAQIGSGEPNLGTNLVLGSIAAAVVGGASLRGGRGTVLAPALGSLLVIGLSVGMNLLQINGQLQPVVVGAILILGAAFDMLRSRAR